MSHTIFRTSQGFTAVQFDVACHCFVGERPAQSQRGEPGTLIPFLSLLLGIAVSADVGHAS